MHTNSTAVCNPRQNPRQNSVLEFFFLTIFFDNIFVRIFLWENYVSNNFFFPKKIFFQLYLVRIFSDKRKKKLLQKLFFLKKQILENFLRKKNYQKKILLEKINSVIFLHLNVSWKKKLSERNKKFLKNCQRKYSYWIFLEKKFLNYLSDWNLTWTEFYLRFPVHFWVVLDKSMLTITKQYVHAAMTSNSHCNYWKLNGCI